MDWKDARKELPPNGRRVLISVHGVFHLATYSKALLAFRLDDGSVFMSRYHDIFWLDMRNVDLPEKERKDVAHEKDAGDAS